MRRPKSGLLLYSASLLQESCAAVPWRGDKLLRNLNTGGLLSSHRWSIHVKNPVYRLSKLFKFGRHQEAHAIKTFGSCLVRTSSSTLIDSL
ncbi:hypothetical protein BDD12DRAFT_446173 [Trichophaea hybrida]|nr:hypothetical protein BDD12DRAFT_446173 [Trichophaea hybrida]